MLPEPTEVEVHLRAADLEWVTRRGSGPGGQHRNKTESAVQVTHAPSGLTVRCESERSQFHNKQSALAVLRARLWAREHEAQNGDRAEARRLQIGSGARGDKRRTVREQDGQVNDHLTGRRWKYRDYVRGEW